MHHFVRQFVDQGAMEKALRTAKVGAGQMECGKYMEIPVFRGILHIGPTLIKRQILEEA